METENMIVNEFENKKEDYELAISVLLQSNAMLTSKLEKAKEALEKIAEFSDDKQTADWNELTIIWGYAYYALKELNKE